MQISIFYADFKKLLKLAKPKTDLETKFLSYCQDTLLYAEKFKTAVMIELKEIKALEEFCVVEPTRTLNEILSSFEQPASATSKSLNNRPDLKEIE